MANDTRPIDPREAVVEHLPAMRAFAASLTRNSAAADDLVQDTIVKAWKNFDKFKPGTNLRAWLFTILRNEFYSQMRKAVREVEDGEGNYAATLVSPAEQDGHIEFEDMKAALLELPDDQREAIILVGASGLSYEEAAEICGTAVGTIKSRVSRARTRLVELMGGTPEAPRALEPALHRTA